MSLLSVGWIAAAGTEHHGATNSITTETPWNSSSDDLKSSFLLTLLQKGIVRTSFSSGHESPGYTELQERRLPQWRYRDDELQTQPVKYPPSLEIIVLQLQSTKWL